MTRIQGIDLNGEDVPRQVKTAFEAQEKRWGQTLQNHLIYARRPTIHRGAQAMWAGLGGSGLLDDGLAAMVNVRIASLNGCVF